ncbi:MAG: tyrosine-type recombinase/integrase [Spiroplasmataceae bacterium]|jgi:integrase/recombinase XerD|nr:tyrosine-type recombinase/integrase [Spiroplasmataceae bacterium]
MNNNLDLTNYTNWLKDRNRSERTIQTYLEALKLFTRNYSITTENIRKFLKNNITKYKPNTLRLFRQSLSSYRKFAKIEIDWEVITGIIPKSMRNLFSTLTLTDFNQLKSVRFERNKWTYERNNLILDFLIFVGLRVTELVNIHHSDWEGKSLRVHGKGNKYRQVFLPKFLIKHLKSDSTDYLFTNRKGQPLSPLVIRQIIQQRLEKSSIDKKITPHSFRRSFATLLHHQGAKLTTIQQLLGHDSIITTERYIQYDFDTLYQDYSKLWKGTSQEKTLLH